jgi:hypothetical protein
LGTQARLGGQLPGLCLCDPRADDCGIATGVQRGPVLGELPLTLVDLLADAEFPGKGIVVLGRR